MIECECIGLGSEDKVEHPGDEWHYAVIMHTELEWEINIIELEELSAYC